MVERQEVEALLAACERDRIGPHPDNETLAALCRAWLAVDEAEICTVGDSGWYELGVIYDISHELVGQRVRIVPVEAREE